MEGSRAPPRKILDLHDWAFRPEGPNRRANIDPFSLCLCADIPLNGFCHQIQALNHQLHDSKLSCLQSFYMASRWALYHHARVSKIDSNWPYTNFASTISRWLSLKLLKLLIQLGWIPGDPKRMSKVFFLKPKFFKSAKTHWFLGSLHWPPLKPLAKTKRRPETRKLQESEALTQNDVIANFQHLFIVIRFALGFQIPREKCHCFQMKVLYCGALDFVLYNTRCAFLESMVLMNAVYSFWP